MTIVTTIQVERNDSTNMIWEGIEKGMFEMRNVIYKVEMDHETPIALHDYDEAEKGRWS